MTSISRRDSLKLLGTLPLLGWGNFSLSKGKSFRYLPTTQPLPAGYFRLAERKGQTLLLTPKEELFFSIGFNHIDPAALRYPENIHLWREKYDNSVKKWLKKSVKPNLKKWGFNSVGNTVEMASNGPTNHRQSRRFTYEEYQHLGLPYFHQLDFADFHHWDAQHRLPDFYASEFEDWCDHVAREFCVPMAEDPLLIGYFYMDCPGWVHTHPHSRWRGPMFDYKKLESEAGRKELFDLATRYYKVTHDAVRRYDKHHLIFGDRYEGRGRMAKEVLMAAKPYVDVLSFQFFHTPEKIRTGLDYWSKEIGMPTLLADTAKHVKMDADKNKGTHDPAVYHQIMDEVLDMPHCLGIHLCGAYTRNDIRKNALLDKLEQEDNPGLLEAITEVNKKAMDWLKTL